MKPTLPAKPDDADDEQQVAFLHSILAQIGMPRNSTDSRTFSRTNGGASLRIEAGAWWNGTDWVDQPLPSGTRPRLVLIHACSEAVRTQSRIVEVANSTRAFLRRLGIAQDGRTMRGFKTQMLALASCRIRSVSSAAPRP